MRIISYFIQLDTLLTSMFSNILHSVGNTIRVQPFFNFQKDGNINWKCIINTKDWIYYIWIPLLWFHRKMCQIMTSRHIAWSQNTIHNYVPFHCERVVETCNIYSKYFFLSLNNTHIYWKVTRRSNFTIMMFMSIVSHLLNDLFVKIL